MPLRAMERRKAASVVKLIESRLFVGCLGFVYFGDDGLESMLRGGKGRSRVG
jgi:hypothetical protein